MLVAMLEQQEILDKRAEIHCLMEQQQRMLLFMRVEADPEEMLELDQQLLGQ